MATPDFISDEEMAALEVQSAPSIGGSMPDFLTDAEMETLSGNSTPSIWQNPIDALTSKDWWLTRPSGEKVTPSQAIVGPTSKLLDGLTLGAGDEMAAGGSALVDALFGDSTLSGAYNNRLSQVRGDQGSLERAAPLVDAGLQLAALKIPMGSLVKTNDGILKTGAKLAGEGAAYGAAVGFNEGEGDLSQRAEDALITGAIAGPASGILGGGAKAIASGIKALPKLAENLEHYSLGARPSDYVRSLKNRGPETDLDGAQSSIKEAFNDVIERGVFKNIKTAEDAYIKNDGMISSLGDNLSLALQQADAKLSHPIFPRLDIAREHVKKYATTPEKPGLLKYLDEYEDLLRSSTDGSLSALQREKIALGRKVYGGKDVGKESVDKYIQADLRTAIEKGSKQALGEASEAVGVIKDINRRLGNHLEVEKVLLRRVGVEEGANPVTGLRGLLRTSGGLLTTPTIIGGGLGSIAGETGSGSAVGLGVGAGLAYASSPKGASQIANKLRGLANVAESSPVSQPEIAEALPRLIATLFGSDDQSRSDGTNSSQREQNTSQNISPEILSELVSKRTLPTANLETQAIDPGQAELLRSGLETSPPETAEQQAPQRQENTSQNQKNSLTSFPSPNNTPISSLFNTLFGEGKTPVSEVFGELEDMARTPQFDAKLDKIAQNLNVPTNDLLKVIGFETGGTYSPSVKNQAGSGATGLLQFMPDTAKELLGTKTKEEAIQKIAAMDEVEQLDLVEKYLLRYKSKIKSLDDLYMAVLYPKAIDKDASYPLFKEGSTAYRQNKGLDKNEDGVITKAEAASKVRNYQV